MMKFVALAVIGCCIGLAANASKKAVDAGMWQDEYLYTAHPMQAATITITLHSPQTLMYITPDGGWFWGDGGAIRFAKDGKASCPTPFLVDMKAVYR